MHPGTSGLERGLAVLEALAGDEASRAGGLGVVRLAELVGADKSQTSRTLATLAAHGMVERDPVTLAYRVGWQVYALAAQAGEPRLPAAAAPLLRRLVRELGESAHLSVRRGASVLTLLSESPASAIHAPVPAGTLTPLLTTSAGRALAVDFDEAELAELGLEGAAARIAEARHLGYAIVREEFEPGLVAAAAPVRDAGGRVVAALNVSAPAFRFADRLEEAAAAVKAAAEELSSELGANDRGLTRTVRV
jgi:DNA-binding IclR family transcriptional regulator